MPSENVRFDNRPLLDDERYFLNMLSHRRLGIGPGALGRSSNEQLAGAWESVLSS